MKLWLIPAASVLMAALAGAQTPPPAAQPQTAPAAGNPSTGGKLYVSYGCYQCHGYEGQGGVAGPRLGPRPLPLAAFSRYVRRPAGVMPPYTEKVMPDADLAHVLAFLEARPAPPPVESLPLLQQ